MYQFRTQTKAWFDQKGLVDVVGCYQAGHDPLRAFARVRFAETKFAS
jgi:hypothetical protein